VIQISKGGREKKMKRLLVVLLMSGLITVFSTTVFALDVKFSGEFYAAGIYLDKTSLQKDTATSGPSTAFYFQRLRVRNDFVVSPGLTLITRFDALERAWGAARSAPGTAVAVDSFGTTAENENIAFDWAYINYTSPVGIFEVGLMNDGSTGTIFGNSLNPAGRIKYSYITGPLRINADITKGKEQSLTAKFTTLNASDADNNKYGLEAIYSWKGGFAGAKVTYYNYAENRPASGYRLDYTLLTPYTIFKVGPVDIQAEVNYAFGKLKEFDNGVGDVRLENLSGWIDTTATFGPVYFGGSFAYISGDDPATADKQEGGTLNGGRDWNPCLILFNFYDRGYWVGALAGNGTSTNVGPMSNAFFYQGRVGFKPVPALDIMASLSYSNADKKPIGYVSDAYGYEVDVTGTYKITNNLSYMLGFGYLVTGDYFKGTNAANNVSNDYLVINKLTLTF
jgi:hypothetical protein